MIPLRPFAQGVGINATGNAPDPSSMLDVSATDRGLLMPRLTTSQRDAVNAPAEGLIIFNSTTKCFESFVLNGWRTVSCPCPLPASPEAGSHTAQATLIQWNWTAVSGATGYKWNTSNNYGTAIDLGNVTTYTQTSLSCGTNVNTYVWAYNDCGNSGSTLLSSATNVCFTCGGSLQDTRDSQTYGTVQIGTQCWMSQNLNYGSYVTAGANAQSPAGTQKYCNSNNSSNCATYGGLYEWPEMMDGGSACNGAGDGQQACSPVVQGICPTGWHIPSHYEWRQLFRAVCTSGNCASTFPYNNSTTGWPPVGTDEGTKLKTGGSSGFNVGLYGSGYSPNGGFYDFNSRGYFWSSTFSNNGNPWYQFLDTGSQVIWNNDTPHTAGVAFSIRCVKD